MYGTTRLGEAEEILGRILAAAPGLQEHVVLATKAGIRPGEGYHGGRDYVLAACEASLGRLGVDTIDLFQIHRVDLFTDPAETVEALVALHGDGKIREVGVSNATPAQLDDLARLLPFPVAAVQAEFSLLDLRPLFDGNLDWCRRNGAVPLSYSPLKGGQLAESGGDVPELLTERLEALARREGVSVSAVCLAFLLAHPARPVPIVGTQVPDRLAAAAGSIRVSLSRADVYGLVEAAQGHPMY